MSRQQPGRRSTPTALTAPSLSGLGQRLTRARDNCFETLPAFVAIALAAELLGQINLLQPLAPWVLASLIAQSVTHVISTAFLAIVIRASFLSVQLAIYVYWTALLVTAGRG